MIYCEGLILAIQLGNSTHLLSDSVFSLDNLVKIPNLENLEKMTLNFVSKFVNS